MKAADFLAGDGAIFARRPAFCHSATKRSSDIDVSRWSSAARRCLSSRRGFTPFGDSARGVEGRGEHPGRSLRTRRSVLDEMVRNQRL